MLSGWGQNINKVFAGIGVFLVAQKVVEWGKHFVDAASEVEDSMRKLDTVLEKTGNTTGLTRNEIEDLGKDIQDLSKFDDEAARSVSTLFATMGNIKGDIFKGGLKASADLATFMHTDLPAAGNILARSLANPERGMMMLRRAGIQFTDSEKERIKTLMDAGKVTDAQTAILEKLNSVVGGQAVAAAKTFSGQMAQFGNRMSDVAEDIGGALMPAIMSLMPALERTAKIVAMLAVPLIKLITWIVEGATAFVEWLVPLDAIEQGITSLIDWVTTFADTVSEYLAPVLDFVKTLLEDVGVAILNTAVAIGSYLAPYVTAIVDTLVEWADTIWSYLKPAIIWVAEGGLLAFTALQTGITNFADVAMIAIEEFALAAVKSFNIIAHVITEVLPAYLAWFGRNWKEIFTDAWELLKTITSNMWENLKNFWEAFKGLFKGEGFNFEWKGLTEGFQATAEELPKIAERVKGDIEKGLEGDIGERAGRVAESFGKNLEANRKMINDLFKDTTPKRKPGAEFAPAEGAKPGEAVDTTTTADKAAKKDKSKDDKTGTIEDLMSLNKRITEAAAGAGKEDKQVAATKDAAVKTADAIDRNTEAVRDQSGLLEDIAGSTGKLAKETPLVGALSDDD
jgi:hypothetical protein